MPLQIALTRQEELDIAYWKAKDIWHQCITDPHATYADMADCSREVQRCFECIVGWRWSAFRKANGFVRPISRIRRELELELELIVELRYSRSNRQGVR